MDYVYPNTNLPAYDIKNMNNLNDKIPHIWVWMYGLNSNWNYITASQMIEYYSV